jgi:nucleoside-diphosphate-sugar epimerase
MPEIIGSFAGSEGTRESAGPAAQARNCSFCGLAQIGLELAERHLDRVQVRRVFGQIAKHRTAVGGLARPRNMAAALEGVDAVIHSAGLAHAMSGIPEDDYRVINTAATIGLARAARRAGARRFVFLSSIRAQCGPTADIMMTDAIEPAPTDPYGKSKLATERGLAELDIDWAALRATLVYGPGVEGNMAQMMGLARYRCRCRSAASERAARSWPWKIWRRQSKPSSPRRERCAALSSRPIRRP